MTGQDGGDTRAERIAASIKERLDREERSRRSFLTRSALAGGTLLAIGGATGSTMAQNGEDDDGGDDGTTDELTENFDDVEGTDVDVLNYALSLERLEDAFYQEALDTLTEEDFVQASSLESYTEEFRREVFGYVETVAEHESTHVDVLTQAVELLGGEPASEETYDFGVESVEDFLSVGQALENTGVAAYAGAAPFIESPDLLSTALSIHSVESRHAALFNELNGESPFPDAFDSAQSQQEVLDTASQFIQSEQTTPDEDTETPTEEDTETPTEEGTETPTEEGTETTTATGGNETTTGGNETTTTGNLTTTTGNETT